MSSPPPITSFKGRYFFLSNFYRRQFRLNGVLYASAEHAFQTQKPIIYADRVRVHTCNSPADAKALANSVPRKPNWDEIKVDIMKNVLRAKFSREFNFQINPLLTFLLNTGEAELVEGNNWGDTFWGQCPLGNGENMLGKLLMKVRSEMRHL